jgi:PAS domain S-box-containing protein
MASIETAPTRCGVRGSGEGVLPSSGTILNAKKKRPPKHGFLPRKDRASLSAERGSRKRRSQPGQDSGMPYEEYFKAASESLIVAGRDGKILQANPKTQELFGYTPEELVGQPVEVLLPGRLHEAHRKHLGGYFGAPRTRAMGTGFNLVGRRKDGSEFPVEVSLTYAPATVRGDVVVAAIIDITQRLAMEREARRAESLTSLGTIAAGIAHDLNNPLQVIMSRAELLLQTPPETLGQEVHEDLTVVYRHAQRAGRIVDEFLRVSRQRDKTLAPININQVVHDAMLLVGHVLRENSIKVDIDLREDLPRVIGDSTALERVLINLITNARDAMPNGGTLRLETGDGTLRPGWVHLRVSDTGTGIDPEQVKKIFDLLYTTKSEGTGLGLWLSRRIVQEHNGRIEVQSQPAEGTSFTIALPPEEVSR